MTLAPGTRIGNYEILGPLGSGGMAEVYRARDTRLERIVAIKALPEAVARDPERLARFEREAKLLASLNHPNIGGIHGLEESGGSPYLVLEFIEGETLAERLKRGALPPREAIEVAGQIACAIEAAHERGVVHRDLKPSNIMLTPSGSVKVLDFGLAKGDAAGATQSRQSPASTTVAMAKTAEGMILGTTAYMSPEQARGKAVDRRTDVWAFGCVLFECLTGIQAYPGETTSDVIAKVLQCEPDWNSIPSHAPPRLRDLLRRCLTKDPEDRPRDIGDLGRELAAIAAESSSVGPSSSGAASTAPTSVPSLAVLYFENLSSDPESDYFCAGVTEDILTDLSKIRGIRVASRNAVARFRGASADISKIASELGVGTVLEGSVQRAGDRVRISAQLINAADGFHLWAERYDRTLQDVFAVQEEIASSIASALSVALTVSESRGLLCDRPGDVHAYDLYLKGRAVYDSFTPEAFQHARRLFEQAVELDPGYALAWAGIADCWGQVLQFYGAAGHQEATDRGLEAARRSIVLDPTLAEGHKAESLVLLYSGDEEGSRAALLRAHRANPRHVPTLINLGVDTIMCGDLAGAERLLRRAMEIDPHDAFTVQWLAALCLWTRRYEEVLQLGRQIRRLSSVPFYLDESHALRIEVALLRGAFAEAERAIREALVDGAKPDLMRLLEAEIAARQGNTQEARKVLDGLVPAIEAHGWLEPGASVAMMCGEVELAVRLLNNPRALPFVPIQVRMNPELVPLLDRPEFGPRRWDVTLIWPLEAPPIDERRRSLFADVKLESGRPGPEEGSSSFAGG